MPRYESLLLGGKVRKSKIDSSSESESEEEEEMVDMGKKMKGGKQCSNERKDTALKVARKVKAAKKISACAYGAGAGGVKGMSYEERCANLAKARATRMANLKKKKMGGGQYNQDYVDESQLNYAGSPLDMYYKIPEKEIKEIREARGENIAPRKKGGKMTAEKFEEMGRVGGGKIKKEKGLEKEMEYMRNSLHTGMSMPTEAQFKRGGAMMKEEEYPLDLKGAIKNLALLAEKFGLRLVK